MTQFATRTTVVLTALTVLAALVAAGCDASDSALQHQLNDRKDVRFKEAAGKVQTVEDTRLASMKATLPGADVKTTPGSPNPLVAWRTNVAAPQPPDAPAAAEGGEGDEAAAPSTKHGVTGWSFPKAHIIDFYGLNGI